MTGFDSSDGYRVAPLDSKEARIGDNERFENKDEEYEINPILSSPDFHFSEEDPATITEPRGTPADRATFNPEA